MSALLSKRSTIILAGIGLVLIGLLGGILGMLYLGRQAEPLPPRIVEQVELGQAVSEPAHATADSGLAARVPEPTQLNTLFKEVASRVTPAVVYIQVEMAPGEWSPEALRNFEGEAPEDFFQRRMPRQSVGSGVVVSESGYIVTNSHVIEGGEQIQVTMADKRRFSARVVGVDPSTDLAVIKAEGAGNLPVISFGNSDALEVGEWVVAVGNPFRLTSTVTAGIVSALGRQVNIIEDRYRIEDFIQTDAAINPGNSGGALVDLQGSLVGISTAIATESGSYEGYGFAVPVNLMKRVVRDLIEFGEVQRGYLGVTIQDIDARLARELELERISGVYVESVQHDGAAAEAGLRGGDVVLSIEGKLVNATNELQSAVASRRPGDSIEIEVLREGALQTFTVQLAAPTEDWVSRQEEEPEPEEPPAQEMPKSNLFELEEWGFGLREMGTREQRAFEGAEGIYLAYIRKGSVAARAGLPRDVILTHVNEAPVRSIEEALRALEQAAEEGETVLLRVQRRDEVSAFYELEAP